MFKLEVKFNLFYSKSMKNQKFIAPIKKTNKAARRIEVKGFLNK